jgi:hypothetical protein
MILTAEAQSDQRTMMVRFPLRGRKAKTDGRKGFESGRPHNPLLRSER